MTLILPQPTDTTKSKSHSKLHRVFATDDGASDQTVVANANNSITVNSTILANSFVGNLIGNASTVTNGVYKNTNNTFTANNTFTGSVVVPNATANNQAVAYGQLATITTNTFHDLTSSRNFGTTYTNTTEKEEKHTVCYKDSGGGGAPTLTITPSGGSAVTMALGYDLSNSNWNQVTFFVEPGDSYSISTTGATKVNWWVWY